MRLIACFLLMLVCNSCFLFSDLKKTRFSFTQKEGSQPVKTVVPKKFNRSERTTDSLGNQVHYFYYPGGAVLYFAFLEDTSTQLQAINYELNIQRPLYETVYFKGFDSSGHYWRESRFGKYRAGYRNGNLEEDGLFDSSINHFSLHHR